MANLKFLLALLFLLQVNIAFSQQLQTDSLLNLYTCSKVDSTKIDLLLQASDAIIDFNPKKAVQFGETALKKAQDIQDSRREQQAYLKIGGGYENIGDITKAITNFNASIKIARKNKDLFALAETNLSLGNVYSDLGNAQLSIEYYTSALQYYSISSDFKGLCRVI